MPIPLRHVVCKGQTRPSCESAKEISIVLKIRRVRTVGWWVRRGVLAVVVVVVAIRLARRLFPDPEADDAAGYVMPGTLDRDYHGIDAVRFDAYMLRHRFVGEPTMVQVTYHFILVVSAVWIVTTIAMLLFVWGQRRKNKRYVELDRNYRETLRALLFAENTYSPDKIQKMLDDCGECLEDNELPPPPTTSTHSSLCLRLLQDIHCKAKNEAAQDTMNHENLQNLFFVAGLRKYCEEVLRNTTSSKQFVTIQYLRQLGVDMPVSIITRLLNSSNLRLRKAARQYYMTLDTEDAYSVLDNGYLDSNYSYWDIIALHNTVAVNVRRGRNAPPFRAFISNTPDSLLKRQLIEEAGFWVDDENMEYLVSSAIHDDASENRRAIYLSIKHHRYAKAEPQLLKNYVDEGVELKVAIVEAIVACGSGKQAEFLRDAFMQATSRKLKRELLHAMLLYNESSRRYFKQLREAVTSDEDRLLFEHIITHEQANVPSIHI